MVFQAKKWLSPVTSFTMTGHDLGFCQGDVPKGVLDVGLLYLGCPWQLGSYRPNLLELFFAGDLLSTLFEVLVRHESNITIINDWRLMLGTWLPETNSKTPLEIGLLPQNERAPNPAFFQLRTWWHNSLGLSALVKPSVGRIPLLLAQCNCPFWNGIYIKLYPLLPNNQWFSWRFPVRQLQKNVRLSGGNPVGIPSKGGSTLFNSLRLEVSQVHLSTLRGATS